jgi:phage-related protein
LTLLSGCVSDGDYSKAISQFTQSANTLTQAFQTLVQNANVVEENHYIDDQAFAGKALNPAEIQGQDILTRDELNLRTAAIKALADYTTALGTLAAGKSAAQVETDAKTASSSLKSLTQDATKALAKPTPKSRTPDYSGPISSAVSAAGEIISLIEKHRGLAEVRESVQKNDSQLTALFALLSSEASELYSRQESAIGDTGDILFRDYNTASTRSPSNSVELLQLTDRIKDYERASAAIVTTDPTKAIDGFKNAHDALVKAILAPKTSKKETLSDVISSVKQFASEVQPLAQDIQALAGSF